MSSEQSEIIRHMKRWNIITEKKKKGKTRQSRERLGKVQITDLPARLYYNPIHYERKNMKLSNVSRELETIKVTP